MDSKKKRETEIYGSFFLNDDEFALSAKSIQEVVNIPTRFTPMPLAPAYLLGVFNLRGMIVPVVDLKPLLGLPMGSSDPSSRKIAIIDHEGVRVGLCFDSTGEIIRSREEERNDFEGSGVVTGALKLSQGTRIIQLLSPMALIHLESIPRSGGGQSNADQMSRLRRSRGDRKQCISFLVGNARCAFGIESIHEIIRVPEIKQSALAGELCVGMLEVRGDIVPVVDFAVILGFRTKAILGEGDDRRIIVMKMGNEKFGLLIDAVESIITYYSEDLLNLPVLSEKKAQIFLGCLSRPESHDVILLSSSEVLSNHELNEITHGHSKIYQSQGTEKEKKSGGQRKTYITFTLESLIGVGIQEIREIIELPTELLHPPGLPKHVKGMINLRGEIVAIVDARTLYKMPENEKLTTPKVLVFERQKVKYGLVVDSVESILSVVDGESLKLPEALYKGNGGFSQDIQQLIEVMSGDQKKTLMILDLDPLAERIGLAAA